MIGEIMMLLTPALLCHKDTAQGNLQGTFWCLPLCLYGIKIRFFLCTLDKDTIEGTKNDLSSSACDSDDGPGVARCACSMI